MPAMGARDKHSASGRRAPWRWIVLVIAAGLSQPLAAADRRQTVCTVTVNSADEKTVFMSHLPASRFRFVELVQPGRADWLNAACKAGVRCDVMVVSGHYDGDNEFFSDRAEAKESLRVSDLERASCSSDCSGLFARLKEVYLFGCNTLNPRPLSSATADFVRSLVRDQASRGTAGRELARLGTVHGESSRERMRQIFKGVPAIYGFPSSAPLGPVAGQALDRYFDAAGTAAVGGGRPNAGLLGEFATSGLSVVAGVSPQESLARWDVCKFADPQLTDVQLARHVHRLLRRDVSQVGTHLDRVQRLTRVLAAKPQRSAALVAAWQDIADDFISRFRFLESARRTEEPAARVRMFALARDLGWLTPAEHRQQLVQLLAALDEQSELGIDEIDLACTLNRNHGLDGALGAITSPEPAAQALPRAALRACLGSAPDRVRTLDALSSGDEHAVQYAQGYLRHRPITDVGELRRVVASVADMASSAAQVRALEALRPHDMGDTAIVARLVRLFAETSDWNVQVAVAGLLIRVDKRLLPREPLLRALTDRRLPSPPGENRIDALITRLRTD